MNWLRRTVSFGDPKADRRNREQSGLLAIISLFQLVHTEKFCCLLKAHTWINSSVKEMMAHSVHVLQIYLSGYVKAQMDDIRVFMQTNLFIRNERPQIEITYCSMDVRQVYVYITGGIIQWVVNLFRTELAVAVRQTIHEKVWLKCLCLHSRFFNFNFIFHFFNIFIWVQCFFFKFMRVNEQSRKHFLKLLKIWRWPSWWLAINFVLIYQYLECLITVWFDSAHLHITSQIISKSKSKKLAGCVEKQFTDDNTSVWQICDIIRNTVVDINAALSALSSRVKLYKNLYINYSCKVF